jgi:hypothetical protein
VIATIIFSYFTISVQIRKTKKADRVETLRNTIAKFLALGMVYGPIKTGTDDEQILQQKNLELSQIIEQAELIIMLLDDSDNGQKSLIGLISETIVLLNADFKKNHVEEFSTKRQEILRLTKEMIKKTVQPTINLSCVPRKLLMYWIIGLLLFIAILNWRFKFLKLEWVESGDKDGKSTSKKSVVPGFEFKIERKPEQPETFIKYKSTDKSLDKSNLPSSTSIENLGPIVTISEKYISRPDSYTGEVIEYRVIVGQFGSEKIVAEIPYKIKEVCDKMMRNPHGSFYDADFMHEHYWVIVWYKRVRHAYKGTDDIWTYSARELPELNIMHDWIYSILGKKKPSFKQDEIKTDEVWVDSGTVWGRGSVADITIEFHSSLRGYVRKFSLKTIGRWEDKASFNPKTGDDTFPYFFSDCKDSICKWADTIIEQNKKRKFFNLPRPTRFSKPRRS